MFLKPAELQKSFLPFSISLKLTLLYAATSFLLLAASGLFLYQALANDLIKDDELFLRGQMRFFTQILHDRPRQFEELKEKIHLENSVGGISSYFVRILSDSGDVLVESSRMGVPSTEFALLEQLNTDTVSYKKQSWQGKTYLLSSARVVSGSAARVLVIELAADITADVNVLHVYRQNLSLILFGGILLASVTGVWITRRGLLPLRKMADSVKKVSAQHLQQRILRDHWPDELKVAPGIE